MYNNLPGETDNFWILRVGILTQILLPEKTEVQRFRGTSYNAQTSLPFYLDESPDVR
jgi:hypothetical protein